MCDPRPNAGPQALGFLCIRDLEGNQEAWEGSLGTGFTPGVRKQLQPCEGEAVRNRQLRFSVVTANDISLWSLWYFITSRQPESE